MGERGPVRDGVRARGWGRASVSAFAAQPETQLNRLGRRRTAGRTTAPVRRSIATSRDRFGGDPSLGAIAREPRDGQAGVDEFLASIGAARCVSRTSSPTGLRRTSSIVDEGPYGELRRDVETSASMTSWRPAVRLRRRRAPVRDGLLRADGICDGGDYVLRFEGQTDGRRAAADGAGADDGAFWWGNAEDEIDTTLTYAVDLTARRDPDADVPHVVRHRALVRLGVRLGLDGRWRDVDGARRRRARRSTTRCAQAYRRRVLRDERRAGGAGVGRRTRRPARRTPARRSCCGSST